MLFCLVSGISVYFPAIMRYADKADGEINDILNSLVKNPHKKEIANALVLYRGGRFILGNIAAIALCVAIGYLDMEARDLHRNNVIIQSCMRSP